MGIHERPDRLDLLNSCLDRWLEGNLASAASEGDFYRSALGQAEPDVAAMLRDREESHIRLLERVAAETRPHMHAFLEDHSDKLPEELQALATKLSPGGSDDGGLLVRLVRASWCDPDSRLMAALVYRNWHGGKVGFQFLPDPRTTDPGEYLTEAEGLEAMLLDGGAPHSLLVGDDRAFLDSLPERFTVYRGVSGVSEDIASWGMCWTLDRDVAEWFALRMADAKCEPTVVTARVQKRHVLLDLAGEKEIVVLPGKARVIKCRRKTLHRPDFAWKPD